MNEASLTAKLMGMNVMPLGAWEVKITKTARMAFSKFADHQIHALLQVKRSTFVYKIRDEGISKKPFDGITFTKSPAWCVCIFTLSMTVYIIDIEDFYNAMRTSGSKSLTEEIAIEISHKVIHL